MLKRISNQLKKKNPAEPSKMRIISFKWNNNKNRLCCYIFVLFIRGIGTKFAHEQKTSFSATVTTYIVYDLVQS